MKQFQLSILLVLLFNTVSAQYSYNTNLPNYFLNVNQTMPVFAANDGNWNVKTTLSNTWGLNNFDDIVPTLGIETYLPKLHSAVYFFGTRQALGSYRSSDMSVGISPRFKLKNGLTLLSNINVQHQGFSRQSDWETFPAPPWENVSKARYLDLGVGTGLIFKGFYLSGQMTNVLNTNAYVYEATPQNTQNSRTLTSLRFMTGKTHRFNERFKLNGSLAFQKILRTTLSYTMAISTTLKYKWLIGAVSFNTNDYLHLALGAEIKDRLHLVYSHTATTSRLMKGSRGTHQIGISYNITKPNQEHQLLPLLSMF